MLIGVFLLLPITLWASPTNTSTTVEELERLSVAGQNDQIDGSSFFSYLTPDNRYATFHSWATGIGPGPDQSGNNWLDVYLRDRIAGTTVKITNGINGTATDEDSFDAVITEDGRYIVYTSYASNLVPNDTNDTLWKREGLDIFLYDTVTQQTQRVSLTYNGGQINGNSAGIISPDGTWIVMNTNGHGILPGSTPAGNNLYLRNWRTGEIRLIATGGDLADGYFSSWWPSRDGRYVVFTSTFSHHVPGDTNNQQDVFLIDTATMQTTLISHNMTGGFANGRSGQSNITPDGRYVIFFSEASDLVPNDTNGVGDVFAYDRQTGVMERISLTAAGGQTNGLSRDASICANGRYISYASDATNIIANDTNGQRDVFVHDRETNTTFVASINSSGQLTNGKSHRTYMSSDCAYVTYASDGSNLIAGDTNDRRDLFMGRIVRPAEFSNSGMTLSLTQPGGNTTFRAVLANSGTEDAQATLWVPVPLHTTLDSGSLPTGATYNASANRVEWQGTVPSESNVVISFEFTVDGGLTEFTMITSDVTLTGDGETRMFTAVTAVNGIPIYLPIVAQS